MKTVALEDTPLTADELATMAQDEAVILTRKGKPIAAIKNLSGADWESASLANNPHFIALIEESRRSYRQEGGIGIVDVRAQLGLNTKRRKKTGRAKRAS